MWPWIFRAEWLWAALALWAASVVALRLAPGRRRLLAGVAIVSASYVGLYLARYAGFFAMLLYAPSAAPFEPGLVEDIAVWAQAVVMVAALAGLLTRLRSPAVWVPILIFTGATLLLGAWLVLNVEDWLPAQD